MERQQQTLIIQQTIDKDQYLKQLMEKQERAKEQINAIHVEIEALRGQNK